MSNISKVAIFSFGHEGSSIPLAKAISSKGIRVDYYLIAKNHMIRSVEGLNVANIWVHKLEGDLPINTIPVLSSYFSKTNVSLKYINTFSECISVPLLRSIMPAIRRWQIMRICTHLNKYKYNAMILVGRYKGTDDIIDYCKNIICDKKIVALHEVCDHQCPDYIHPSKLLEFLFEQKCHINVFSHNSYNNILNYEHADENLISCIPFGTFDTFKYLANISIEGLPNDYILFYGMISPYKGLSVLVDAIKRSPYLHSMKTVIAGSGYDAALDGIKKDKSFFVINRYLTNNEIVTLIRRARVVVCPYLSMSQSGIIQTVFAIGKPIIASDLLGFREVIKDRLNGLLVSPGDSIQLASAIEKIYLDADLYNTLQNGANNFATFFPNYNWSLIAGNYLKIISK